MGAYAVDLSRLDTTVSVLAARTDVVDALLADLDARVAALHEAWSGSAAGAHLDAHRRSTITD